MVMLKEFACPWPIHFGTSLSIFFKFWHGRDLDKRSFNKCSYKLEMSWYVYLLSRVRKLSVLLKHSPNQDTDTTDKLTSSQPMESLLDQIKQELLASKGCWEEGLERLQKLYKYQPIPGIRYISMCQDKELYTNTRIYLGSVHLQYRFLLLV